MPGHRGDNGVRCPAQHSHRALDNASFQSARSAIEGVPHGAISVPAGVSPCWVLRIKIVPSSEGRVGESFENLWVLEQALSRLESQTIGGTHSESVVRKMV